jgi:hypothetical protein
MNGIRIRGRRRRRRRRRRRIFCFKVSLFCFFLVEAEVEKMTTMMLRMMMQILTI